MGGPLQEKSAATVGELAQLLSVPNHQGTVNGEAVDADYELASNDYVIFSEKVKGA